MLQFLTNGWFFVQKKLDSTPMYRTVSIGLAVLVLYAMTLGFWGALPYSGFEQLFSLSTALATAFFVNTLFSTLWRVPVNTESAVITALIIFFLIIPAELASGGWWLIVAATTLAMASKFLIAWRGQHLLNPAATGTLLLVVIFAIFPLEGYFEATWWVGQRELLIPLLLVGVAVVAKVRKWVPVSLFIVVSLLVYLFEDWRILGAVTESSFTNWLSGPSLFLAFFMLTEPFTMPPTKPLQAGYGAVVGFISQTTLFSLLGVKMSPELALLLGNMLAYPFTLRRKLRLPLLEKHAVADNTYEFVFAKPADFTFKAGQYLEWMLPHNGADNRGIRRYFTIASAPSNDTIRLCVRFAPAMSSFKRALRNLKLGETIIASQLAGDFTLPKDATGKIACVAGGIGITPFMSHLEEMEHAGVTYDTTLFYCSNITTEIAYKDRFDELAKRLPLTVVHVLAKEQLDGYETGFLTTDIIRRRAPDFLARDWYLSGPPSMVNSYKKLLRGLGVPGNRIVCDFFSGLV